MPVSVRLLFLIVPLVGLQCVIVVFPDHTHLLFDCRNAILRYSGTSYGHTVVTVVFFSVGRDVYRYLV